MSLHAAVDWTSLLSKDPDALPVLQSSIEDWKPSQNRVTQVFDDRRLELGFRSFVFCGRLLSGMLATVASCVFAFVIALYSDSPDWVLALNIIGLVLSFGIGVTATLSAVFRDHPIFANTSALDLGESPDDFTEFDEVRDAAIAANIPRKGRYLIATIEEFSLAFNYSIALIVQSVCCYAKYSSCAAQGKQGDKCFDFVDAYIFAVLEAYCVIAPARFAFVLPACVTAISLFALSYTWSTKYVDLEDVVHAQRVVLEFLIAVVNLIACYVRESSLRQAFIEKVKADGSLSIVQRKRDEIALLLPKMLPVCTLESLSLASNDPRKFFHSAACSVFRSDIINFTNWSTHHSVFQVIEMLSELTDKFDEAAAKVGVEKVKTIGDAYWAVAGLPLAAENPAWRIFKFAHVATQSIDTFRRAGMPEGMRIGIGSGEGSAAVVGRAQVSFEVFGEANDIAEGLEKIGVAGAIVVCSATKRQLEDLLAPCTFQLHQVGSYRAVMTSEHPSAPGSELSTPARITFDVDLVRRSLVRYEGESNVEAAIEDLQQRLVENYNQRSVDPRQLAMGYEDTHLEDFFARYGIVMERLPFKVCAVELCLALLILGVYVSTTDGHSDGRAGTDGPIAMIWISFGLSLVLPLLLWGFPPQSKLGVAVILGIYYASGALGIIGAGLATPTYVTRNVFYLRMVFAVLKGSVRSIPAIWGILHDLFPTVAYTITLWARPSAMGNLPHGDAFLIEYTIWIVASYFVGFLCRLSNEISNRQIFLVDCISTVSAAAVNGESLVAHQLITRVVPVEFSDVVIKWFTTLTDAPNDFSAPKTSVFSGRHPTVSPRGSPGTGSPGLKQREILYYDIKEAAVAFIKIRKQAGANEPTSETEPDIFLNAHDHIETCLAQHPNLMKIKTVADTMLIVALPNTQRINGDLSFEDNLSQDRVSELLRFLVALPQLLRHQGDVIRVGHETNVTAGLHVGPLVGTVLGAQRLTFDVLGDTVNTASRLCSTGTPGQVCLSDAAMRLSVDHAGLRATVRPLDRFLKGKGTVRVYELAFEHLFSPSLPPLGRTFE